MLEQIRELAKFLSSRTAPVSFGYGRADDLNRLADKLPLTLPASGFLLFNEGYFDAVPRILQGGAFQHTHSLSLLIMCRSSLADGPEQKLINYEILRPLYKRAYIWLDSRGEITNARATMNLVINRTDCNLDGIRLSLSIKTPIETIC